MKILFSLLLTLGVATHSLAQGKVGLVNDSLHLVYWAGTVYAGQPYVVGEGGMTLAIELWAGTSSTSLQLVGSTGFAGQGGPGTWPRLNITLPFSAGPAFFAVDIYDQAAGSYINAVTHPGYIAATSGLFTANASGTIAYNSIVNHNSPANSTWADGTYNLDGVSPGFRGAIMLGIPEPSVFPLAGLALAVLLILRPRRK